MIFIQHVPAAIGAYELIGWSEMGARAEILISTGVMDPFWDS